MLERWIEFPPEDYLHIFPIWVRMRNIPVNHYTYETIEQIGEEIGQVKKVAFDPSKSQSKGYVCVQVLFDVSRPLKQKRQWWLLLVRLNILDLSMRDFGNGVLSAKD